MSTLSVPLSPEFEAFIEAQVKSGRAANKADVVRKALARMSEEEAIEAVLRAKKEVTIGNYAKGDLRELMKRMK